MIREEHVYVMLGLEDPHEFAKKRVALNKAHMDMALLPHGLSRQTGRSTRIMVSEIAELLNRDRYTVIFPFKHHDSPVTVELAQHDRRRFERALHKIGASYMVKAADAPWVYDYECWWPLRDDKGEAMSPVEVIR